MYSQLFGKLNLQIDAICWRRLGEAHTALSNYNTARNSYNYARKLFEKLGNKEQLGVIWHIIGVLEADFAKDAKAKVCYFKAEKLFREIESYSGIASVRRDLARIKTKAGYYKEAVRDYKQCLDIYQNRVSDDNGLAWTFYALGRCLADQGKLLEARNYNKKALELFRKQEENERGIAWSHYSLGILMLNLGKNTSAYVCAKTALNRFRKLKNMGGIAHSLHVLGRAAFRKGSDYYVISSKCYEESLAIYRDSKNLPGIAYALEGFARISAVQEQSARAARLLGAAQSLRKKIKCPLPLPDRSDYKQSVIAARKQLNRDIFIEMWALGREMSLEKIITEALLNNV